MNPTRVPKKSELLCWATEGHETYTGDERVKFFPSALQLELLIQWLKYSVFTKEWCSFKS